MTVVLRLEGPIPSKKNNYKRGRDGHVYIPAAVRGQIDDLIILAKSQRHKLDLASIEGSKLRVSVIFTNATERQDLDNMYTTLLDVLQKAGIIKNDKLVRGASYDEVVIPGLKLPFVDIAIEKKLSTKS